MGDLVEQSRRPLAIESSESLWRETGLVALGVGAMGGAVALVPAVVGSWPVVFLPIAGAAAAGLVLWRPWPVLRKAGVIGGAVALAALPLGVRSWPWWTVPLAGLVSGGLGGGVAAVVLAAHHRQLLQQMLWAIERAAGRDLDGDGSKGKPSPWTLPPVRRPTFVYVGERATDNDDRWTAEAEADAAQLADMQAEDEARDLAYVVNRIWPADPNGYKIGTSWRAWQGETLPSGLRMTRRRWTEIMALLERAQLVRRANPDSRAPYLPTATRAQVLLALRELLPEAAGDE